jgi:hypothetical protein
VTNGHLKHYMTSSLYDVTAHGTLSHAALHCSVSAFRPVNIALVRHIACVAIPNKTHYYCCCCCCCYYTHPHIFNNDNLLLSSFKIHQVSQKHLVRDLLLVSAHNLRPSPRKLPPFSTVIRWPHVITRLSLDCHLIAHAHESAFVCHLWAAKQPPSLTDLRPGVSWYSFLEPESTPGHMVPSVASEKIPSDTTGDRSQDPPTSSVVS